MQARRAVARRPGAADRRSRQARPGAARPDRHADLPIRRALSDHPRQGDRRRRRRRRRQRAQPAIQAHGVRHRDRPRPGQRSRSPTPRLPDATPRRTHPPPPAPPRPAAPVSVATNDNRNRVSEKPSNVHVQVRSSSTVSSSPARCSTIVSLAGGCSSIDRLSQIGEKPALTAIENPTAQPGYKPVQMPMPKPEAVSYNANSLWRNGSRAFFKDQRAAPDRRHPDRHRQHHRQGQHRQRDPAQPHQQGRFRRSPISLGSKLLTGNAAKVLPGPAPDRGLAPRPATARARSSARKALQTNVAAVVTQVLPNGNLVVEGKQEIRVNFEIRELIVAGIVRPEDIQSDNTIDFQQDRAGPHRLWRPRPDHRRAAAALRPAGARRAAAVLDLNSTSSHITSRT